MHTNDKNAYDNLIKDFEVDQVESLDVKRLDKPLTQDEIIEKLAGGDETKGSCASLCLAYTGNVHGLDVTDFRGGISQSKFGRLINTVDTYKTSNATISAHYVQKEAFDVAKILKELPSNGKEYVLIAGKHVSVVRNIDGVLQYLEMQTVDRNGWTPFVKKVKEYGRMYKYTTVDTLNKRFGCQKTQTKHIYKDDNGEWKTGSKVFLIDVESVKPTEEFKTILSYLNTEKQKQKKGASGYAK